LQRSTFHVDMYDIRGGLLFPDAFCGFSGPVVYCTDEPFAIYVYGVHYSVEPCIKKYYTRRIIDYDLFQPKNRSHRCEHLSPGRPDRLISS
jgi:hypothetical protein